MVDALDEAGGFTINILSDSQRSLSSYFAGGWKEPEPPPFRFAAWEAGPRLEGSLASIGCALVERIAGGDHWIIVGRIIALEQGPEPRRPLLFYAGKYRRLDEEASPAPDLDREPPPVQMFYDPWQSG
jgi:3-hydroxy-9,10-secoandrosta-1,3,5(10)-triene-9,17-dione monooxygenase reductase component